MAHPRSLIIIPTLNGKAELERLLKSLCVQTCQPDVCVVDSGSTDGSVAIASKFNATVDSISAKEFNHGGTRQMMVEKYSNYDFYIFLTQDAYLENENAVENIIAPFIDDSIGAVCGRQLPHHDATPAAEHARIFNYPADSRIKSLANVDELGIKTAFMSNSFAAYRREALVGVGGFPIHVILAEDMYVAAKMILNGWKIAYRGDACARHSHNYTFFEEFKRYFDTGVFQSREPWIRETFGKTEGEGKRFAISELRYIGLHRFWLWPASIIRSAIKLIGYRAGLAEKHAPLWLKKRISMHKGFWETAR